MALIGSLASGVNAMQSFVKGMEVIGDNIANSKTAGFKRQRVSYTDNFSDTLRDATSGGSSLSNIPPIQVGTGVSVGAAQKIFSQGAVELTGVSSDLAISGDGFFRVADLQNDRQLLTRDGSFRVDQDGFLTDKNGHFLMGLTGGSATTDPSTIGRVQIDLADDVKLDDQNRPLDSSNRIVLEDGTRVISRTDGTTTTNYRVDSEGRLLDTTFDLAATPAETNYNVHQAIILPNAEDPSDPANPFEMRALLHDDGKYYLVNDIGNYINSTGAEVGAELTPATSTSFDVTSADPGSLGAVEWVPSELPFATIGGGLDSEAVWNETQISAAAPSVSDPNQFRLAIQSWNINKDGQLSLALNDGTTYVRAQVLLQTVEDEDGLVEEGSGLYSGIGNAGPKGVIAWDFGATLSSEELAFHIPNQSGVGFIQARALEGSNTDLTQEFADMITTQRAFQAGSKVITVSDEMLQEIINLKR